MTPTALSILIFAIVFLTGFVLGVNVGRSSKENR